MGFSNPIATAGGALVRESIQSPNYEPGVSGWAANRDGTAEFQDVVIRGNITYVGTYGYGTYGTGTYGGDD